jgi:hypothetical protein
MFNNFFFLSENRAVYDLMSQNMVYSGGVINDTRPCTCTRPRARTPPPPPPYTQKYIILIFHGNSGVANAPQCYVIRTLAVLSVIILSITGTSLH